MYLRGFSDQRLRKLALECFENFIKPDIKAALMNEIQKRKSDGYQILLLSGSLPCLVEPMVQYTGADFMICSDVEIVNGRYKGEMKTLHPYGKNKKLLADNFCKEHGFRLEQACVYANEWADRFLLESAGEAIAVDPDKKLEKLAGVKKWRITKNLLKENA
jgi:phosphoserine phosphatase